MVGRSTRPQGYFRHCVKSLVDIIIDYKILIINIEHKTLHPHCGYFAVVSKRFYRRGFNVHENQTCLYIVRHTQRFAAARRRHRSTVRISFRNSYRKNCGGKTVRTRRRNYRSVEGPACNLNTTYIILIVVLKLLIKSK